MKKGIALKIAGFLLFFLIALIILFPVNNLRSYIFETVFRESGVLMVAESLHLSLLGLPGVKMDKVSVTLPVGSQEIDLQSDQLTLRLALTSFFPPQIGLAASVSDLKKGGDIYTRVGRGNNTFSFYLNVERLNLEQLGARSGGSPFKGSLDASSDIFLNETELAKSSGYLKIKILDFSLNQQSISPPELGGLTIIIPAMKMGKLDGALTMKNGLLEINQLKFGDDPNSDLKGTVSGDFKVEKKFEDSQLNLALKLKLSAKIMENPESATFKSALGGFQNNPGEYSLRCNGTIQDFINSPLYPCRKLD